MHINSKALLLVLICVTLLIFVLSWPRHDLADQSTAIEQEQTDAIATAVVPQPESPSENRFLGVIVARDSVDITAEFGGTLESVDVEIGDRIARNARIAVLDTHLIREQLAMAEISLQTAKAEERKALLQMAEAKDRYSRRELLVKSGLLPKEELATAKFQEEILTAGLEIARNHVAQEALRVKQLEQELSHGEIRAPFEGTVAARYKAAGNTVDRQTPIITLIKAGDLWVRAAVAETDNIGIAGGTRITVFVESLNVSINGVIQHIAPALDAARMRLFEAKLDIPISLKGKIKPGMVGRISLKGSQ